MFMVLYKRKEQKQIEKNENKIDAIYMHNILNSRNHKYEDQIKMEEA